MKTLLIKVLGQTKQYPALLVDFGRGYTFNWNEDLRAYAYKPKDQTEVDEIFQSQSIHAVWTFAPVLVDGDEAPASTAVATPEAEQEIARLTGLLTSATETIARLRAELAASKKPPLTSRRGRPPKVTDTPSELAPE